MPSPFKPKPAPKSRRNQPADFAESAAASVGFVPTIAPSLGLARPRVARRVQLAGVVGLWLAAVAALGMALGTFLVPSPPATTVGAPVATQPIAVESVAPAELTNRQTWANATLTTASFQAALGAGALQPGYTPTVPNQAPAAATAPARGAAD